MSLTRDGKLYTLKSAASAPENEEDEQGSHFLSCAQAKRCPRKGCEFFLVMVNFMLTANADVADTTGAAVTENSEDVLADCIAPLRQEYADILESPSGLPPDRGIEHVIPLLRDSQPLSGRMYWLLPDELTEVKAQVTGVLQRGLTEPSTSAWGSLILFVKKKTEELRMVVDYRALNNLTVKNWFPLPRIDDLFDALHGANCFTSLDAASGFHQILPKSEDRPKTALS